MPKQLQLFAESHQSFTLGDLVYKHTGSCWRGKIVGYYSTILNPEGYVVESIKEPGSCQIYPAKALSLLLD